MKDDQRGIERSLQLCKTHEQVQECARIITVSQKSKVPAYGINNYNGEVDFDEI